MPGITQEHSQTAEHGQELAAGADLRNFATALTHDLQDRIPQEQRAERDTLDQQHADLTRQAGNDMLAGRQLERFTSTQQEQLGDLHALETWTGDTLSRALGNRAGQPGDQQLRAAVGEALAGLREYRDRQMVQLVRDQTDIRAALGADHARGDHAALEGVLSRQSSQADELADANRQLRGDVQEQLGRDQRHDLDAAIIGQLRQNVSATLLAAQGTTLSPEALRVPDDGIRRLAAKAEVDDQASARQRDAALQQVKGQLLEELLNNLGQARAAELNAGRPADRQLEFIAGNRIRDERNRQLSDGLLAWRDRENRLHIEEAFEAKAGLASARGLTRAMKALAASDQELPRYARDLARDTVLGGQRQGEELEVYVRRQAVQLATLSEVQKLAIEKETNRWLAELKRYRTQAETGQMDKLIERLHESADHATRILIDGRPETLAVGQGRSRVRAVLPSDVALRHDDLAPLAVGVRSAGLLEAAGRLMDDLN